MPQRSQRPQRDDDSSIGPDDAWRTANLEAWAAQNGPLYRRDWLDHLTEEERAEWGPELLDEIEATAAPPKPAPQVSVQPLQDFDELMAELDAESGEPDEGDEPDESDD